MKTKDDLKKIAEASAERIRIEQERQEQLQKRSKVEKLTDDLCQKIEDISARSGKFSFEVIHHYHRYFTDQYHSFNFEDCEEEIFEELRCRGFEVSIKNQIIPVIVITFD